MKGNLSSKRIGIVSLLLLIGALRLNADVVFLKDLGSEGRLVGVANPVIEQQVTPSSEGGATKKLPLMKVDSYELTWLPQGKSQTNVIWSIPRRSTIPTSSAPSFAFMDAKLTSANELLCIFRLSDAVFSIALDLAGAKRDVWQEALKVVDGHNRDPAKFRMPKRIGTAELVAGANPAEPKLLVNSTEGSELFVLAGNESWRSLGPVASAVFQKDFPGIGRITGKEVPTTLPDFPSEPSARKAAQRQSAEFQAMMKEVRFPLKDYYTPQTIHRYEVLFLSQEGSEATRVTSFVTFFAPVISRSPTGFQFMDATVDADRILVAFKEQGTIFTLSKSIHDGKSREHIAEVTSEGDMLVFSNGKFSKRDGTVTLDLAGSAPTRRYRWIGQRSWERIAWP